LAALVPDRLAERIMLRMGTDRLAALHMAIALVRRDGTIISDWGVRRPDRSAADDDDLRQAATLRMGQANVRRWVDEILPLLVDDDPLGVDSFATHRNLLDEAADAYSMFQKEARWCRQSAVPALTVVA
jgi:hypothetical protein